MLSALGSANTIFALASAGGRAGVAVVRVSGPRARTALADLMGGGQHALLPRQAICSLLKDPATGETLDNGLIIWFPGPASFTGEDVVELHLHGGTAVLSGVLDVLIKMDGLRIAEPGEFTRRAFENGKMDLTAAEGLADLIEAETVVQRRQALRQLEGELGQVYESWRQRLLGALAHSEAAIDFSDEDLPKDIEAAALLEVSSLEREITNHLMDKRRGEKLRSGALITIIGPPNAGKSSLLNLLAKRDVAIVSEIAGTTRDVIEVHLDLGGYPVIFADTAGLHNTRNSIEIEGMRRARRKAEDADLKLAVFDIGDWLDPDPTTLGLIDADTLIVLNKSDLQATKPPLTFKGNAVFVVSAWSGDGIENLMDVITDRVVGMMGVGASPALTRIRHREALEDCRSALGRCLKGPGLASELAAEDLRMATRHLGRITGQVDVDDVLDFIFQNFCIGK